jgi:TolB-like protein
MRFQIQSIAVALVLGVAFAGVSHAQPPSPAQAMVDIAVVEFTPGPNAPGMTYEAKRQLQATLAYELAKTRRFHVVDVRNTRAASQSDLATINGSASTAAATRLGKQLRVAYVVTGTVEEYTPQGGDGFGRVVLKTRLVEVATGKVVHAEEVVQRSNSRMLTSNPAEMHTRTIRPALQKLAATLVGLRY